MESYSTSRTRWTRALDTIAMVAADVSFSERSAVTRALYAVMLADEMNLTPAHAAELATQAAWVSPQRELSARAQQLIDDADKAMIGKLEGYSDGDRFYNDTHLPEDVRERAYRLVNDGKKIDAIKLIRDVTGMGLREAKELADEMKNDAPINLNRYDDETSF